ncbi:MAG TPA: hypothetical protein VG265_04405, partial [Gaiellaceae bacterium]|nr:hypothetical protein [Gaiellaceae bacterium]
YYDAPGATVTMTYKVMAGRSIVYARQVKSRISSDGRATLPVGFKPIKGKSYTMAIYTGDKNGQVEQTTYALLPTS